MSNKSKRNSTVSHSDISEFIISWLNSKIEYVGAQLILYVMKHPDKELGILEISSHLPHQNTKCRTKYPINQGIGRTFEMIDKKTQAECLERIKKLKEAIAADLELGFEEEAKAKQKEIDAILYYLKETTINSRIKCFPNIKDKEYQRLYISYRRILKQANDEYPEIASYIDKHMKTGKTFKWISEQVNNGYN